MESKYQFIYQPKKTISSALGAYLREIFMRSPLFWSIMIFCDVMHAMRYPLSFYLVGICIDQLTNLSPQDGLPDIVWVYTALIGITLLIGELFHAVSHYFAFNRLQFLKPQVRSDILAYTLKHSYTYFQDQFAGSLARKVSETAEQVFNLHQQIRFEIVLPLMSMFLSAIVIFQIFWPFGVAAIGFVVLITLPVFIKLRKTRVKSQKMADARSLVMGQIVDTLTNMSAVKSYAREDLEMQEHYDVSSQEMKAWNKVLRVFLLMENYRRLFLVFIGGGMMAGCLLAWEAGTISIGDISAIMGMSFGFTSMVWGFSFGIIHIAESVGTLNDSLSLLLVPHGIQDNENADKLRISKGEIAFENVHFQYGDIDIFKDMSVTLSSHQRIGLIGISGAGKSTFVNLIQRMFDVQGGCISIDGQNISLCTQQSLREQIAIIPQDTSLFHRTLMDNIRYGRPEASDCEVMDAAKKAHAHEFIELLPDGYETLVGERGIKLSGGQRQRVAIARAILKDAPILILDEATSALDSESERLIQDSLEELMEGKTVIAIAHRLSTISHLDRLLVMKNGVIVEDGDHEELLNAQGVYAKLWAMQSGGFLPE